MAGSATAGNDDGNGFTADILNDLQRIAVEESRLGIPFITGRDVIHGHLTVFPIPLGQAASWNPDTVRSGCRAAAVEASADGVHWTFSPMIDVSRDPRWGRMAESYGESPYLNAVLGVAAVEGYQGDDLSAPDSIAACAKHFVGYGAAEGGRDYNSTEISAATLYDVYLPPFEAVTHAQCQTFMTSFNEIGGIPSCANEPLIDGVLRKKWGFDGFVVTDWAAVWELIEHGVAADRHHASRQALGAGSDMDMCDSCYVDTLADLVASSAVDEQQIRQAARRIVTVKFRLGLFDRPYVAAGSVDRQPFRTAARASVAECAILLENNGILPLPSQPPLKQGNPGRELVGTIGVLGPMAHATKELFGTWTLDGVPEEVTSLAGALQQQLSDSWRVVTTTSQADSECSLVADSCDALVVVLGEHPSRSGEANSVANPGLPAGQEAFLTQMLDLNIPVIAVIISGRATVLPAAVKRCSALLFSFHPGSEGGLGLADVLTGRAEPGGRLPITLPRHQGQIPIYHDHKPTGRPRDEYHRSSMNPNGHRQSRLLDCPGSPLYRFGYGLTYTEFALAQSTISVQSDNSLQIETAVTNSGQRVGSMVLQVYVRPQVAETSQPVRRLIGHKRVTVGPGETTTEIITIPRESLAYHHRDGTRSVDPGRYDFFVGQHASDGEAMTIAIP